MGLESVTVEMVAEVTSMTGLLRSSVQSEKPGKQKRKRESRKEGRGESKKEKENMRSQRKEIFRKQSTATMFQRGEVK